MGEREKSIKKKEMSPPSKYMMNSAMTTKEVDRIREKSDLHK